MWMHHYSGCKVFISETVIFNMTKKSRCFSGITGSPSKVEDKTFPIDVYVAADMIYFLFCMFPVHARVSPAHERVVLHVALQWIGDLCMLQPASTNEIWNSTHLPLHGQFLHGPSQAS